MKKSFWKFAAMSALVAFSVACSKDDDDNGPGGDSPKNIAEVASSDARFSILVDALGKANLVQTVANTPNLTVFAPTNDAFNNLFTQLGVSDLDALIGALGVEATTNVLLYHVLGARVPANDVTTGYVATLGTAHGNNLSAFINVRNNGVRINDRADVIQTDINASNGVIHAIDAVILPLTIAELAALNMDFSTLVSGLGVADGNIDALLADPSSGPLTVFAPTNAAFTDLVTELGVGDVPGLLAAIGTDGLAEVILYHAVSGNITSAQVTAGTVPTVNGQNFTITVNGGVSITDTQSRTANVIATDVQGTNGIVHVLNKVILPVL
jgi:transforming growth factor-beta-induced protein